VSEVNIQWFLYGMDLLGTSVFAISGTIVSRNQGLDFFGALVIAFVTAVGGGTLRDIMIGSTPVGWMQDLNYLLAIASGVLLAILFGKSIAKWNKTMFFFDAIGIGLFTILGLEKTLGIGLSPIVALIMGMVSAVFGGVLRDVLANRIPLIFRSEIYATACLSGGILYLILTLSQLDRSIAMSLSIALIISIRIIAVRTKWHFPEF